MSCIFGRNFCPIQPVAIRVIATVFLLLLPPFYPLHSLLLNATQFRNVLQRAYCVLNGKCVRQSIPLAPPFFLQTPAHFLNFEISEGGEDQMLLWPGNRPPSSSPRAQHHHHQHHSPGAWTPRGLCTLVYERIRWQVFPRSPTTMYEREGGTPTRLSLILGLERFTPPIHSSFSGRNPRVRQPRLSLQTHLPRRQL